MSKTIHQRAMLVNLKLSKWTATKYDKKISQEVAQNHNATADAGRYNKRLIEKGKHSYAALMSAFSELYSNHVQQTLPWSDEGWRLIPNTNYDKYTAMVRAGRMKIEQLLEDFLADYPAIQADAQRHQNGLYNPSDWPSVVDLRKRFSIKANFNPVPHTSDFRVDLDSETLAQITRETEERVNAAVQEAQKESFNRLHEVVRKISERLNDPEATFRDSLIENARELTDVLTRLNVADDPRLEEMRKRVEDLAQVSPEALRSLPFQRATTASEADRILADMQAVFEVQHGN
jgi:hypothetical protein